MTETCEYFHGAVRTLVGHGPVKQRLIDAYRQYLASLGAAEVPEPIAAQFSALNAVLHGAHAAGGLSAPEVAVRKMSEKDAASHAASILEMFVTLAELREREPAAPRLRVVSDEDEAPAFLNRA
jgi:hypothetical protein